MRHLPTGTAYLPSAPVNQLFITVLCMLFVALITPVDTLWSQQLHFQHIGEVQGLKKKTITCGLQDKDGFLWFGTENGLLRYDGYTFKEFLYNPKNIHSLSSNLVYALVEDRQGTLWVGTVGGGLNRYDPDSRRFIRYLHDPQDPNSLSHNGVVALMVDSADNLWIGTEGGGLNRLSPDRITFTHFKHSPDIPDSLSFDTIWHLHEDRAGSIWVGTYGGGLNLFVQESETFIHYRHEQDNTQSLTSDTIGALFEDSRGNFWVGTNRGLNLLDRESGLALRLQHDPNNPKSLPSGHIWDIHEDKQGLLWIGSFGGGVFTFNPVDTLFTPLPSSPGNPLSPSSDLVWFIFESSDKVMWIGTDGGGLNKLVLISQDFHHHVAGPERMGALLYNGINDATETEDEVLWLANDGGGFQSFDRNAGKSRLYLHDPANPHSLQSDLTEAILADSNGIVWIGTYGGGLNAYDPRTEVYTGIVHDPLTPASLSDNRIWSLYEDSHSNLWVGTRNGLNRLNPQRTEINRFMHDPEDPGSISDNGIWDIYEDSANRIWVGTDNGLNMLREDNLSFERYYADPESAGRLSHNHVTVIFEDSRKILWVGTNGGLNRRNPGSNSFDHYTVQHGLGSDSIRGILEDDMGVLWITTVTDLARLEPSTGKMYTFDKSDGLQGSEFSRAHLKTRAGELLIGGRNGINIFKPSTIRQNSHIPPVFLTGLKKHNREVIDTNLTTLDHIDLDYSENTIRFEFAALDYNNPERNSYAYMLEGFDEGWVMSGTMRNATYTNLDGGSYVFRVKGSNNHGVWNEEGIRIGLWVTTPPWQSWWARFLYLAVLVTSMIGLLEFRARKHKQRLAAIQQVNRELEREVTERQKAEEALTISRQRLSMALEAAQEGMWEFYPQTGKTYFGGSWFTMLGYRPDAFTHSYDTWAKLLHPDDRPSMEKYLRDFINGQGETFTTEFRMRARDNTYRWIQVSGKTFERDQDNNIIRMSGVHLDITERKQWLTSLERSERRYRDLFNEAPVMYVITEEIEGKTLIRNVNNTFLATLGYRREEVIGTPLDQYYTESSRDIEAITEKRQQILTGSFKTKERSFLTRDKRIIHTLLHALPERDNEGKVTGIRAMFLDISTRKEAEQEAKRLETALNQSQKMEAIGTLAGGIAHDFNNILAAIIGYCELLLMDFTKGEPHHGKLEQIYRAGQRAKVLVQQILAFSRHDERTLKPLQVPPLIGEAVQLLRSSLPATITINVEIDDQVPNIIADPTQIHQVVINLCTNAFQALPDGGQVSIGVHSLKLDKNDHTANLSPGNYLKLTVRDTGTGISPEMIDNIFNPYFTSKKRGKGTGLGLAVVNGIVQSYNGTITVQSKPGEGTLFKVLIPATEQPLEIELQQGHTIPQGDEHILFVDDEATLVDMNTRILETLGYKVTGTVSSRDALNIFSREPENYDLLITDMTMPEFTGDKLAGSIKAIRPDMPVILMTGYSEKLENTPLEELGVDEVLYKPVGKASLAEAIRKALDTN